MPNGPRVAWLSRFFGVKAVVAAGLAFGMLLSPKLWLAERFFPTAPLFDFLSTVPSPLDALWFGGLLGLLVLIVVWPRPVWPTAFFLVSAVLLVLWDQTRCQPWFYLYLGLLAAIGLGRDGESALNVCRLLMAATYFWSGLQKLNVGFVEDAFPWLLDPLLKSLGIAVDPDGPIPAWLVRAGWGAALLETAIGVGLLFRPTRPFAVPLALGMHALLLTMLGPLGHDWNTVVWPWNGVMMLLLLLLFAQTPTVSWRAVVWPGRSVLHGAAMLLFGVMPLFNFFGWWDSYLSMALYSGNTMDGWVMISPAVRDRLSPEAQQFATLLDDGQYRVEVMDWSMAELNVPPNPERRVFLALARRFQALAAEPDEVGLIVREGPHWWTGQKIDTWYDGPKVAGK